MRRPTLLILIPLLCSLAAAGQTRRPRSGDTYLLTHLKPGTHIEVESTASSPADLDERCHLISVDATTLTCAADDDHHVRLVFPMDKVGAVYQVHRKVHIGAILGIAVAGTFIGGLATACAPAIAVGILGGLIALAVVQVHAEQRAWRYVWGIPPPPPAPPDNLTLVYWR